MQRCAAAGNNVPRRAAARKACGQKGISMRGHAPAGKSTQQHASTRTRARTRDSVKQHAPACGSMQQGATAFTKCEERDIPCATKALCNKYPHVVKLAMFSHSTQQHAAACTNMRRHTPACGRPVSNDRAPARNNMQQHAVHSCTEATEHQLLCAPLRGPMQSELPHSTGSAGHNAYAA